MTTTTAERSLGAPSRPTPATHPQILCALEELTAAHPYERKLLVCQHPAQGRELLRALALAGTPWIGWESTSPRRLAYDLVALQLTRAGLRLADEFDLIALVDEALDNVQARGAAGPFAPVAGAVGYRDAIRRAVVALRAAGIGPAEFAARRPAGNAKLAAIGAVLEVYEATLEARRLVDTPGLLRRANTLIREGRANLPSGQLFLLPGHTLRGLEGEFNRLLLEVGGAEVLTTEPAEASQLPGSARIFAAATPADELREVLRRIVGQRIPWDRVEIVSTDTTTYGATLDGLLRRLQVPATYATGLDTRRTRVGRAVTAYFRWLGDGFPTYLLRELLEAGDLAPPAETEGVTAAALARALRRLRIGWGHERYLPAITRALNALRNAPLDAEVDAEEAAANRERRIRELEALHDLLEPILTAIPDAPDRARTRRINTSPANLAAALLRFLDAVPRGDLVENNARKLMRDRLERVRTTLTRVTSWESALAILQAQVETRAAPGGQDRLAPWTSTGGHLHLADIRTGGLSARPYTFVVGLDATRVTSGSIPDPVLNDSDRIAFNRGYAPGTAPLPTTSELVQESRQELAALFARLRGEVTLSYSAWDLAEGRAISPAPELLQQLRRWTGDDALTYDELRAAHGPLACAVPRGSQPLDATDIWLDVLWNDGVLLRGDELVRTAFPDLARGHAAALLRYGDEVTAYHGLLTPRPGLDPSSAENTIFSATRLEALGSCPRRYFYQYLLEIREPDDPEWDPESWLTPLERGTLLHTVYEATLRAAREQELEPDDVAFAELALATLYAAVEETTYRVPPPSTAVHEAEVQALEGDIHAFVELIRAQRPDWIELEFGFGTGERRVTVEIGGRPVRLRGAIDRVDRVAPGVLRVVDYKTGGHRGYRPTRPFRGGRRIQHLLYTLAAERLLGEEVEAMEYHFPTRRGQNEVVRYGKELLGRGAEVLEHLFEIARAGHFVTTEDTGDCRYCGYAPICRASTDDYGGTHCPEVAWVRARAWPEKPKKGEAPGDPPVAYRRLVALRGIDG